VAKKACRFCHLDRQRNRVLHETPSLFVILSNPRLMPGHALVIPKQHVGAVYDLDPDVREELLSTVLLFQEHMIINFSQRRKKPAGCDVSWHTRPFMPTTALTVPGHAHVHLRPRYFEDPFFHAVSTHETKVFKRVSKAERERYEALLKWT
jgi:ATP adenylyltransferase